MACNLNYMRRRMQLGAQPHKAKASGAVATFRTNLAAKLDSLFVDVTPVQDLHGQQYPYPPGGSKNLFGAKLSDCKTINTIGTWTGDNYAVSGVTYSIDTTNDGYITSIRTSGTATATTALVIGGIEMTSGVSYIVSGCPAGGGNNKYEIMPMQRPSPGVGSVGGHDYGEGVEYTETTTTTRGLQAVIRNGQNSNGLVFYPMVRLATVTDATFAPYSNVCPITGWAAAKVTGTGVNLFDPESTGKEWVDTSNVLGYRNGAKSNRVVCSEGMTFALSQKNASSSRNVMLISFLDKNDKVLSRKVKANGDTVLTDTAPAGAVVCLASFLAWTDTDEQQLEIGSTATAYTPYVGTTAVIQFGSTLYGARIDWKGRKAVCTHVGVDMGTLTWNYATTYKCFTAFIEDIKVYAANQKPDIISEQYKTVVSRSAVYWETADDMSIGTRATYSNVVVKDSRYTDKNTFTTAVNGVWMVYPLATPFEIPLDLVDFVTVPGVNNVFADCGNTDLSYWTNV